MKRILYGTGVIVFVSALAIGATGAFFSDKETSTGNTFTAGAIDLKVDSTQHYNGNTCQLVGTEVKTYQWVGQSDYPVVGTPCDGTWTLTDLGPTNKFFNFGDVKPGDQGEDTVSLHIDNNPAWACLDLKTTSNLENGINGPEAAAGDVSSTTGELAQNIHFQAWLDQGSIAGFQGSSTDATEGDNIWQVGEPALASGSLSNLNSTTTLALADSSTGTPLPPTGTNYVGLFWCAGTITGGAGNLGCDGSTMGNDAQTDSATADVTFRVEQSRNNARFTCSAPITVGANDLETSLANAGTSGKWYWYNDTTNVLDNTLGTFVAGPATPPIGTGSAKANPLADATGRTLFTNSGFGGTTLASISNLSYSYYQPSGAWSSTEAPFLRFNVDFATSSPSSLFYQGSLVWVPSTNGITGQDAWKDTGNMMASGSLWVYSRSFWPAGLTTVVNTVPGTTARTMSSILADYPNIKMHSLFPQIGMRTGEPGVAGLTANLDKFSITISGVNKTFDFGN